MIKLCVIQERHDLGVVHTINRVVSPAIRFQSKMI